MNRFDCRTTTAPIPRRCRQSWLWTGIARTTRRQAGPLIDGPVQRAEETASGGSGHRKVGGLVCCLVPDPARNARNRVRNPLRSTSILECQRKPYRIRSRTDIAVVPQQRVGELQPNRKLHTEVVGIDHRQRHSLHGRLDGSRAEVLGRTGPECAAGDAERLRIHTELAIIGSGNEDLVLRDTAGNHQTSVRNLDVEAADSHRAIPNHDRHTGTHAGTGVVNLVQLAGVPILEIVLRPRYRGGRVRHTTPHQSQSCCRTRITERVMSFFHVEPPFGYTPGQIRFEQDSTSPIECISHGRASARYALHLEHDA